MTNEYKPRAYQVPPEGDWLVENVPGYETFTRESVRVDGDTLHIEGRVELCEVTCTVVVE